MNPPTTDHLWPAQRKASSTFRRNCIGQQHKSWFEEQKPVFFKGLLRITTFLKGFMWGTSGPRRQTEWPLSGTIRPSIHFLPLLQKTGTGTDCRPWTSRINSFGCFLLFIFQIRNNGATVLKGELRSSNTRFPQTLVALIWIINCANKKLKVQKETPFHPKSLKVVWMSHRENNRNS